MQEALVTLRPPTATALDRMAFERFLADLFARFVNVSGDRLEAEVLEGLRRLVEFLGIDRSSLARITPNGDVVILCSYAAPGTLSPHPIGSIGVDLPWYTNELMEGRVVQFSDIDELPPEAVAERMVCSTWGLESYVGIPVSVAGMPLAVLCLSSARCKQHFPPDAFSRLRLTGEVLANAMVRRNSDLRYHRLQAELSHVTRVSTMGQLAASIAHELNQPLCAIANNAHAAIRQLESPHPDLEEVLAALIDISSDGKRAGEVVTRSHRLMKRRELVFEPISINDVVRDVASLVHGEVIIRRVTLDLELDEKVPRVLGDRVQLQQVVLNIIINAMDANAGMPDGSRHVVIRSELSGRNVRVAVRDTGIGLTPEIAARMFDPFFTTKPNGLGMGLAINQAIIEAHSGDLHAEPNEERGATVEFWLPAINADAG